MNWYRIQRRESDALVFIFGQIGVFGTGAKEFLVELGDVEKVKVFIDSPGGNGLDAIAIYDVLRERETTVEITGRCFSAAVTIAMSGKTVRIHPDARMMIHRPVTAVLGDSDAIRYEAKHMDKLTAQIIAAVTRRTRCPIKKVEGFFRSGEDNYFTPEEALAVGLVDSILEREESPEIQLAKRATAAVPAVAPFTDEEQLLIDLFRAIGTIPTHNRARLMRELGVALTYQVKEL